MSPLAVNVLFAASRAEAGVRVRALIDCVVRYEGRTRGAARVQITRTTRELWALGLVELHGRKPSDGTMTERVIEAHEIAARAFAAPETFYAFCTALRGDDPWGDAETCVRSKARAAQKRPRLHVARITVTAQGRARLAAVLSASAGDVIPPPAGGPASPASLTAI
jgi:hypothetical protein